jgi:excisionase family DNA binding protein
MDLLSVPQAAAELDVTEGRIRQLLYSGMLKGERIGWQWVIERAEVERYKTERRPPGRPPKSDG